MSKKLIVCLLFLFFSIKMVFCAEESLLVKHKREEDQITGDRRSKRLAVEQLKLQKLSLNDLYRRI